MLDRRALLLAGSAMLAGCASAAESAPTPAQSAQADADFRDLVDRLGARFRPTRAFLLHRVDPTRLTPEGRILYEAILPGAEADTALAERNWGADGLPYAVTHRNGTYRRVSGLGVDEDARRLARAVNNETNQLEGDAARGVTAPSFVLDAAISAVEAAARQGAQLNGNWNESLSDALERQLNVLRRLRTDASDEAGVWRLPEGDAFYAQSLQFQLGARVDPREAHERALARCRELQSEADTLLRAQGLTQGDVAERLRTLGADPRYLAADETAKAEAVADMGRRLARVRTLLAASIEGVADAPAEVRRLALDREAGGTRGERRGTTYFVDLGAPRASWTLPSVVHHELIPGHILQTPYERGAEAPRLQVRYAQGYSEGWSIYAEQLADEAGAFADDPLARIGYLQWMLFRFGRIVADTGMNVLRWSRERAIAELRALQGDSAGFVTIEDDVTRYCAQPGAYAAQGLAALHMAELRERTRRSAGASFDLMRFHGAVLRHGPLSPPGLEQAVRAAFTA